MIPHVRSIITWQYFRVRHCFKYCLHIILCGSCGLDQQDLFLSSDQERDQTEDINKPIDRKRVSENQFHNYYQSVLLLPECIEIFTSFPNTSFSIFSFSLSLSIKSSTESAQAQLHPTYIPYSALW